MMVLQQSLYLEVDTALTSDHWDMCPHKCLRLCSLGRGGGEGGGEGAGERGGEGTNTAENSTLSSILVVPAHPIPACMHIHWLD